MLQDYITSCVAADFFTWSGVGWSLHLKMAMMYVPTNSKYFVCGSEESLSILKKPLHLLSHRIFVSNFGQRFQPNSINGVYASLSKLPPKIPSHTILILETSLDQLQVATLCSDHRSLTSSDHQLSVRPISYAGPPLCEDAMP